MWEGDAFSFANLNPTLFVLPEYETGTFGVFFFPLLSVLPKEHETPEGIVKRQSFYVSTGHESLLFFPFFSSFLISQIETRGIMLYRFMIKSCTVKEVGVAQVTAVPAFFLHSRFLFQLFLNFFHLLLYCDTHEKEEM